MTGYNATAMRGRERPPEGATAAAGTPLLPGPGPVAEWPHEAGQGPGGLGWSVAGLLLAPMAGLATAAAAAVRRPSALVALMLIMICVPVQFDVGGSTVGVGDVTSVLVVLAAAITAIRDRRPVSALTAAMFGALVLAASAATLTAADPGASLAGWVRYVQLFVLVPLAVFIAARSRRDAVLIGHAMLLAALVQGAVGIWQFLTGTGASYAGESIRAVGTFGADGVLAMSTVVGLGLVLALGLALGAEGRHRLAYAAVAAVLVVPLGLSLSRGSWIATAAAALVVVLCAGVRIFLVAVAAAAAAATIVVGGFGVGSELLGERVESITSSVGSPDSSVSDRYYLWQTAVGIWGEHPVTGAGIKAFPEFRDVHAPLGLNSGSDVAQAGQGFHREELLSPHNQYLLVLSEQGALGGVAFAVVVLVLAGGAVLATRIRARPEARGIRYAVAGLASWQAIAFLYGDLGGAVSLFASVILGLAASALESRRSSGLHPPPVLGSAPPSTPGPPAPPSAAVAHQPVAHQPVAHQPVAQKTMAQKTAVQKTAARQPVAAEEAAGEPRSKRGFLAKAAMVSAVLVALGSASGLARDLLLATLFGASAATDAFLVAWTVPETVAPLLIEGTMAMVMVPAFGRAVAAAQERQQHTVPGLETDPVRELIEGTLPRMLLALAGTGVLIAAGAPWLVEILAPGLADPGLATRCMQAVAVTVPLMGLAGYLAAALRTFDRFAAPASMFLAYNVGIIATMLVTYQYFGIVGAALGIAVGSALMVLVQLPAAVGRVPFPRGFSLRRSTTLVTLAAVVPVAVYSLTRQAQTFVERFAASPLPEGTISHLNFAQKVAQIPITLAFVAVTVTFPIFVRSATAGRYAEARVRMEKDTLLVGAIALVATAYLWVFAPAVVATVFERGAFTAEDTEQTAAIMRAYVLGLAGQAMVGVLIRPYFTHPGAARWPAVAMLLGLAATIVATALLVGGYGAVGIAVANAIGISVAALVLVGGSRRLPPITPGRGAYGRLGLLLVPAAAVVVIGTWWRGLVEGSAAPFVAISGGLVVVVCYAAIIGLHQWLLPSAASPLRGTEQEHHQQ